MVTKTTLRQFKAPLLYILILAFVALGSVYLFRKIRILVKKQEVFNEIYTQEYCIFQFTKNRTDLLVYQKNNLSCLAKLEINSDNIVIISENLTINAIFRLNDESEFEIIKCDTLKDILCGKYSLTVTNSGINLLGENKVLIKATKIP